MFSVGATYLLYNTILFLCPLLCWYSQKKGHKYGVYIAYIILFVVSAIRYDIGFDYANYYSKFTDLTDTFRFGTFEWNQLNFEEPFAIIFSYIFQWAENSFIYIFAAYSLLTIFLLYKTFDYFNIHTMGIFLYMLSWIMFQSWDWVRQALALSFFLYSIQYIEQQSFAKYTLCIIGAMMAHYSAVILLFVYPLSKLSINKKIALCILIGTLGFSVFGFLDFLKTKLFSLIPYYSLIYSGTDYETAGGNHASKMILLTAIIYIVYIVILDEKYKYLQMPLIIGSILFMVSADNLNIDRIAWYFTSIQLIAVPVSIKHINISELKGSIIIALFVVQFCLFNIIDIGNTIRGCAPYDTIFSSNCTNLYFRDRESVNLLK